MDRIAEIWDRVQRCLLYVEECLPAVTKQHQRVISVLEVVRIEKHVRPGHWQWLGRRREDRKALARAFVAKACYNLPTTKALVERLRADRTLRQICGWELVGDVPSESTFCRAFGEFASTDLGDAVHEALVREYLRNRLVGHICRDSTEASAREKPILKEATKKGPKFPRGRPKKGEVRPPKEPTRIERQYTQTSAEAISELPVACDVGTKIDSKGNRRYWVGYKFHVDVADGGIPISALTTSASLHDSQAAIPLARMSAERVTSLYDLMDSAYDADLIRKVSVELGHVPIIETNTRGHKGAPMEPDRARRYDIRATVERFYSRLKEDCGGRMVRVQGHRKVHAHLMFGLLVIFAEALLGLVT